MRSSKLWLFVGPAVAVVVLALGWLLLVSPKMSEASQLAEETSSAQASNVMAQAKLTTLQQQSKTLPAQKAQLVALQRQIPADPAVADLIRSLNAAATATGVHLDQVTPGALAPIGGGAAGSTGGLQQMPVMMGTTGSYANQVKFLAAVEHLDRALLVTSVNLAGDPSVAPPAGTIPGLKLAINANAFVSTPVVAPPAPAQPAAEASSAPAQ
jgi:Tfp pilus assembly protein PilO